VVRLFFGGAGSAKRIEGAVQGGVADAKPVLSLMK
jgi:hypothetical protein